jgi:predicted alpha/beta superfamily hydrolase
MKNKYITGLIIFLQLHTIAQTQNQSTTIDSLHSAIWQQQRTFKVVLPPDYNPSNKYDVLYVLDGTGNTDETTQIMGFLRGSGFMPQVIVVGIYQVNRNIMLQVIHFSASPGDQHF